MSRTQLNGYRSDAGQPQAHTLAALVLAASRILGREVKASELYDLGEDEPSTELTREYRTDQRVRKKYVSRFDKLLRRHNATLTTLAARSGLSRQAIRNLRMKATSPLVPTIRALVKALRSMGYDVRASDIVDVGE